MFSVKQGEVIFDKRSACSCIVTSEKYYGCFPKNTGVIYWAILVVTPRAEPRMKTCQSKLFFFSHGAMTFLRSRCGEEIQMSCLAFGTFSVHSCASFCIIQMQIRESQY